MKWSEIGEEKRREENKREEKRRENEAVKGAIF